MPFWRLQQGLDLACQNKLVTRQEGPHGLLQYTYSDACVFDRAWSDITILARGIVIDPMGSKLVATPFPKFFNFGERQDPLPDEFFDVYDKVDGSLIILFHHKNEWITATKGSFYSDQAFWAKEQILATAKQLSPGITYCLEAVYPQNRIVLKYDHEALYLLAAYERDGHEINHTGLDTMAHYNSWRRPKRHRYKHLTDVVEHSLTLEGIEGWVIRFEGGHRIKIKTEQYKRLHKLISRVTPLAVWEAMQADDDLQAWKKELPEEFWDDFDQIECLLTQQLASMMLGVHELATHHEHLSDKDLGILLPTINHRYKNFIFTYRNKNGRSKGNVRYRHSLFQAIRPTGNHLPGYQSSIQMNRVVEETR